jgi:hypothetical protein
MADDLGSDGDRTFREGGALNKIHDLANKWEARAKKAERARRAGVLERLAWAASGSAIGIIIGHFIQL